MPGYFVIREIASQSKYCTMSTAPDKHEAINVVGAGIFGLSTALHLAGRGYQNVTVFDKQPYDKLLYSYLHGCDAASAGAIAYPQCIS